MHQMTTPDSSDPREEMVVDLANRRIRTTVGPLDYAEGTEPLAAATLEILESIGVIVDTLIPEDN